MAPKFLSSKPALLVTALLLLHAVFLYGSLRTEFIPQSPPLSTFPNQLGSWHTVREIPMEPEIQEVLKADDSLNRVYTNDGRELSLFVAAFRSQKNGKAPHSPKNCLPGSGWLPVSSGEVALDVGRPEPVSVNRYVISFGQSRSLVLYWYQSRDRTVADEFEAKFYVMYDAMRLNRTDTALVRVVVPIRDRNEDEAQRRGEDFVRALYKPLLEHLPS